MKRSAAALSLLLAATVVTAQSAYRWTDRTGRVHYSDQPPRPGKTQVIERRPLQGNSVETSGMPYATRRAAQDFPVLLYTSSDCKAECDEARRLLAGRGIPYQEQVLITREDMEAFRARFRTEPFVPSLSVGSRTVRGFLNSDWNAELSAAGYPSSVSPEARPPRPVPQPAPRPPSAAGGAK